MRNHVIVKSDQARRDQWNRTKGYADGYAAKPRESREPAYLAGYRRGVEARAADTA